jgi:cytochrome d ubiquinol oxidase subunit II
MNDSVDFWARVLWISMGLGLMAYSVSAGADFGAGVWTLFSARRDRDRVREAVLHAIAPIWEANHVWLIFVIVVMFSAFPRAFAVISVALEVPISLALLGIVLRGAAFSFHAYGIHRERTKERWARLFAWSSLLAPLALGAAVGGVSSGEIRVGATGVTSPLVAGWCTPFAALVGAFALSLFALLSACYLAAETQGDLAEAFRRRALAGEVVGFVFAALVLFSARTQAPQLFDGLLGSPWSWAVQVATAVFALATTWFLYRRVVRVARWTAAAQVASVVLGWGFAMDGHFVLPDVSLTNSGSHPEVLRALALALVAGSLLLAPALVYLYRVFKLTQR